MLSDLFPSFRGLSQATRAQPGQEILENYFGDSTAKNIIKFWQKDILRERCVAAYW
ncbi:hypothetical protein BDV10DRAFT_159554 [Aspergillus recurvatus]